MAYIPSSTASTALKNSNANASADSFIAGYTTTATSAGTLTLTVNDTQQQYLTGTTTHTVVLPVTSTKVLGQSFTICNNSTGIVTVQSSGTNTVQTMAGGTWAIYTVINTGVTTAAGWNVQNLSGGFVTPTITTKTTGSGNYTTPANVSYLRVRMVGPGGGGAGSGSGSFGSSNGVAGSAATTFGTTLLSAGAGGGAVSGNSGSGGTGGTSSLGSAIGTALTGGIGDGTGQNSTASAGYGPGGSGASTPFGGAGGGGTIAAVGTAAAANTGSGGGGAGWSNGATFDGGAGGGAGGYVDAIIAPTAAQVFAYVVGTGGAGGSAGTGGNLGGAGANGYIEITEYYANGAIGTATNVTGIVAQANGGTGQTTVSAASQTQNQVFLSQGNGYGAVNTKIRRFTATDINAGAAMTYADSSNNGGSITINTAGVYSISYTDMASGGAASMGVSVNGSALTTSAGSLSFAQGLRAFTTTPAANLLAFCGVTLYLAVNDIVRAQTDGNCDLTTDRCIFNITKVL